MALVYSSSNPDEGPSAPEFRALRRRSVERCFWLGTTKEKAGEETPAFGAVDLLSNKNVQHQRRLFR